MTDRRPLLLVIATGPQPYREYLFDSLAHEYRVHLIHTEPAGWELPYIIDSTVVANFHPPALLAAARVVAARETVTGVLCWDEARIHAAAVVAQELGLPGGDPKVIERCRDKYLTRVALAESEIPQPDFALVGTIDEALAAADRLGYPVVLKPRAAAASYGVVLAPGVAEVTEHFSFSHDATVPEAPQHSSPVLVEEYLEGPEISVDSVVSDGVVTAVFVARKQIGFPPFFEETQHLVHGADPLLADTGFRALIQAVHSALGFRTGWTHSEFKLTAVGPKLIEVNARLGGDLIPYLGLRATGLNPALLAAAAATGRPIDVTGPDVVAVAGVRFLYAPEDDVVVVDAEFDQAVLPTAVDRAFTAPAGTRVRHPPAGLVSGRVAVVTARAATGPECLTALDAAEDALRLKIKPTP